MLSYWKKILHHMWPVESRQNEKKVHFGIGTIETDVPYSEKIHLGNTTTASYFATQLLRLHFRNIFTQIYGPGSSVGTATDYGLDGTGSNTGGTRFSARPDRPWGPPSLLYNGYQVFPRGKVWPVRAADHSPPVMGHTGPVTGSLYLSLFT